MLTQPCPPPLQVLVIPTDEELSIAQQTLEVVSSSSGGSSSSSSTAAAA
jgi:hypothetical protein